MKTQLAIIIICSAFSFSANAQYNNLLQRQKPYEIAKLKEQKVTNQSVFMEVNGSQGPYGINFFDENGRIIKSVSPKNRQYFTYDAGGRLINWIDSAHDGRRFYPNTYSFAYDAGGKPNHFKLQNNDCVFTYDAAQKLLTETVNANLLHTYKFTAEDKLSEEEFTENGLVKKHKYFYNKYGDLASEVLSTESANGSDSVSTIYSYDSKGRLLRKQVIHKSSVNESEDPTEPPTVTKTTEIYSYTYNLQTGLLSAENCMSSVPGKNTKTEWTYDNNGLLIKEAKYDAAGKPLQVFHYKYNYNRP